MRSLSVCLLAVLVACAREEPADSAAAMDSTPMSPAGTAPSLESYAGTWNMRTMGMASDSVLLNFTMTATNDTTGWSYTFPSSPTPVPIRILSVESGGVMLEAGPYRSNLRPGAMVTTRGNVRMDGDTLRGEVVANYTGGPGDSVVNLRTVGTRAR